MKRYLGVLLVLFMIVVGFTSCTENQRAKSFGGDISIEIPSGMKVTNITWKGDELWYSTRPFATGEVACTQTFYENSSWGLVEGTVTFVESGSADSTKTALMHDNSKTTREAIVLMDPGRSEYASYNYNELLKATEPKATLDGTLTNQTQEGFRVASDGFIEPGFVLIE